MIRNMGSTDRLIRAGAGVVLLFLAFFTGIGGEGWVKWLLAVIGVVMLVTAAIRFCPAYLPFGIRTCEKS